MKRIVLIVFALSLLVGTGCCKQSEQAVVVGAERTELYLDSLTGKRVAMLGNHTSLVRLAPVEGQRSKARRNTNIRWICYLRRA